MDIPEIKKVVDQIGSAFNEYKKANDERLAEIAKKGSAPAGIEEKLAKLNAEMDKLTELKTRLETVEVAFKRGGHKTAEEKKSEISAKQSEAMSLYLRKGDTTLMDKLVEEKTMSVGSDADGGYLVTPDTSGRIITRINETSDMRLAGASVQSISTDALEGLVDIDDADGAWTGETQAPSTSKTPVLGKYRIPTHELTTEPKITQKLIEDASVDPEAWLARKVSDKFARLENTAFISGNGIARPRGILTYAAGTTHGKIEQVNSGAAGAITGDGLISLIYSMKAAYRARARFAMARATVAEVRKLKDLEGNYLWAPGLVAGQPSSLLGFSVAEFADLPAIAANAVGAIVFADFGSAYQIVDRTGISVLVDPFTAKPYVKYYTRRRVGGDVVDFDAIKLQKVAV
jgi:HK97 family phage major capsid protein